MTLEQLIARFRTEAHDKVEPYFCSDADVTAWLNDAVNEACIRARLIHESSPITNLTEITVTAAEATYDLHDSLYELDHIAFKMEGDTCRRQLYLISREELDVLMPDWRDRAGIPEYAIQTDRRLRLVPSPAEDGLLLLEGYRLPLAAMVDGDDEPDIHQEHHRHLVHWALHKAFSVPDSEFFDRDRSAKAEAEFTSYFGLRPDADLRRKTREDVPHHVQAFWV